MGKQKLNPNATQKPNDQDFIGVSATAIDCAFERRDSGFPYAREIWDSYDELYKPDTSQFIFGGRIEKDERTEKVYDALNKSGITQFLGIATGLDTHGLAVTKNNKDTVYVEMLMTEEAKIKQEVLKGVSKQIGGVPNNLHIIEGNALDPESYEKASEYFDPTKPVAVVNQGLLVYFTMEQKEQLAKNIQWLLSEFGGKWFTADLRAVTPPPSLIERMKRLEAKTGVKQHFFESQEQIDGLLQRTGLKQKMIGNDEGSAKKLTNVEKFGHNLKCYEVGLREQGKKK